MGRIWQQAMERAGLGEIAERALTGSGLDAADLERLRSSELLLVGSLADAVRKKHRGAEVRVLTPERARQERGLLRVEPALGATGLTGEEALREVALARLAHSATRSIGVSFDDIGLHLAQVALIFGADLWWGELGGKRTLPLLDGAAARRREIEGLLSRAGRSVRWDEAEAVSLAGHS
jgi:2-iminoacetate synthase ThiH